VQLPVGLERIGNFAFADCSTLKTLTIQPGLKKIGQVPFSYSGIDKLIFRGHAPANTAINAFADTSADFQIFYRDSKDGFTWPSWHGVPTTPLGPQIAVRKTPGKFLRDGAKTLLGATAIGKNTTKTYRIFNIGTTPLKRLSLSLDRAINKEFKFTRLATTSLSPGESTTFTITFSPQRSGRRNAVMHISSNDQEDHSIDIKLTGKGTR